QPQTAQQRQQIEQQLKQLEFNKKEAKITESNKKEQEKLAREAAAARQALFVSRKFRLRR
ncbi:MAG: hypothetical protein ACE5FC_06155, partial [Myxococcota bacterium]